MAANRMAAILLSALLVSGPANRGWVITILHGDVIRPGESWDINIDDGTGYCKYDFMAKFVDDTQAKKDNVNVCEVADFYFND